MALQTSGQIRLLDIQNEFGGAAPIRLSEYYRGGIYVPDTAGNTSIPTAGQIKLSDFYGASSGFVMTVTEGGDSYGYGYYLASNFNGTPNYSVQQGSVSPTQYNGVLLMGARRLVAKDESESFTVEFRGARSKSFFESVTVQGGGTLTSASASYSQAKNTNNLVLRTVWSWAIATGTYSRWNGTGTSTIVFV